LRRAISHTLAEAGFCRDVAQAMLSKLPPARRGGTTNAANRGRG